MRDRGSVSGAEDLPFSFEALGAKEQENALPKGAPETLRRIEAKRAMAAEADMQGKCALKHGREQLGEVVASIVDHAFGQSVERKNSERFNTDIDRATYGGDVYRPQPRAGAVIASPGLGKTSANHRKLAEVGGLGMVSLLGAPRYDLAEQMLRDQVEVDREAGVENAETRTRLFKAEERACEETCGMDSPLFKQRAEARKAGLQAEDVCLPKTAKDGKVINPGCPYREKCPFWTQRENQGQVEVWIATHDAIRAGSMKAAGIDVRFDYMYVDEAPNAVFLKEEEFRIEDLPEGLANEVIGIEEQIGYIREFRDQAFSLDDIRPELRSKYVIRWRWLRKSVERLADHQLKVASGETSNEDASSFTPEEFGELKQNLGLLQRVKLCLYEIARKSEFGLNPDGDDYRDGVQERKEARYHGQDTSGLTIKQLVTRHKEVDTAILAIRYLLSQAAHGETFEMGRVQGCGKVVKLLSRVELEDYGGFWLKPGQSFGAYQNRSGHDEFYLFDMDDMWAAYYGACAFYKEEKAIQKAHRRGKLDTSGWNDLAHILFDELLDTCQDDDGKSHYTHPVKKPKPPVSQLGQANVLFGDGTATEVIMERYLDMMPQSSSVRPHQVETILVPHDEEAVNIVQEGVEERDAMNSRRSWLADDERGQNRRQTLEELIESIVQQGKKVAVICPKKLINRSEDTKHLELRTEYEGPGSVIFMTHGATTGMNDAQNCDVLILVSEAVPPIWSVEDKAMVLFQRPVGRVQHDFGLEHIDSGKDGNVRLMSYAVHPDPCAEALRWSFWEGQQIQALERARTIMRGRGEGFEPLTVYNFSRLPLDYDSVEAGKLTRFKRTIFDRVLDRGVIVDVTNQKGGVRELHNALVDEAHQVSKKKWKTQLEKRPAVLEFGSGVEGLPAELIHTVEGVEGEHIEKSVHGLVDPRKVSEIEALGIRVEGPARIIMTAWRKATIEAGDQIEATLMIKDVADEVARVSGGKVSSNIVKNALEGRGVIKKKKTGLQVTIRVRTSEGEGLYDYLLPRDNQG